MNLCVHVCIGGTEITATHISFMDVDFSGDFTPFQQSTRVSIYFIFCYPHIPMTPILTEITVSWGCCPAPALGEWNFQSCRGCLCFLVYKCLPGLIPSCLMCWGAGGHSRFTPHQHLVVLTPGSKCATGSSDTAFGCAGKTSLWFRSCSEQLYRIVSAPLQRLHGSFVLIYFSFSHILGSAPVPS